MAPRYRVTLTGDGGKDLEALTWKGKTGAKKFISVHALLFCDTGPDEPAWNIAAAARSLGVTARQLSI